MTDGSNAQTAAAPGPDQAHAQLVRDYVAARARLIRSLASHRSLTGAGRETAIVELLRDLLPRRYEALTGTVINPSPSGTKPQVQLDVMVANTFDFPTPIRHGSVSCILPQSLVAAIEVKSELSASDFIKAMAQIRKSRELIPGNTHVSLFSFLHPSTADQLKSWLGALFDIANASVPPPAMEEAISTNGVSISATAYRLARSTKWTVDGLPDLIVGISGGIAILRPPKEQAPPTYDLFTAKDAGLSALLHELLEVLLEQERAQLTTRRDSPESIYEPEASPVANLKAEDERRSVRWQATGALDGWETMRRLHRIPDAAQDQFEVILEDLQ